MPSRFPPGFKIVAGRKMSNTPFSPLYTRPAARQASNWRTLDLATSFSDRLWPCSLIWSIQLQRDVLTEWRPPRAIDSYDARTFSCYFCHLAVLTFSKPKGLKFQLEIMYLASKGSLSFNFYLRKITDTFFKIFKLWSISFRAMKDKVEQTSSHLYINEILKQ